MSVSKPLSTRRPKVVIVGGGFAGIEAAVTLGEAAADITIIDRGNSSVFQPLLYQVALAVLAPTDIAQPIRSIFKNRTNVHVLLSEVLEIDRTRKSILLGMGESLAYDYLILATGSEASYFGHDTWKSHAPGLKTIDDALEIRTRVFVAFEEAERAVATGSAEPDLHFVVIGGGPTGVELAGAIADIAKRALKKEFTRIDTSRTKVSLFEAAPAILNQFPEELRQQAIKQLNELGVKVHTGLPITDIQRHHIVVGDGKIPVTLTIWAAGVSPSPLGQKLGLPVDRRGCVLVDQFLNPSDEPMIFVCGDLAAVEEGGRRIPAVAQPAMQMGKHAAKQIIADLSGRKRFAFHYFDKGDMATIGVRAAVARIVWPFTANLSGTPAWLAWLLVHLAFLRGPDRQLSVLITWVYSYLRRVARARLITGKQAREVVDAPVKSKAAN